MLKNKIKYEFEKNGAINTTEYAGVYIRGIYMNHTTGHFVPEDVESVIMYI